ncbi:MAG: biotin--[acetyl-CoA-carboxylase] ligase [Hyphomicrobiaceae bacterium]
MNRLPDGYRAEHLGDIDSTNTEAFRRAEAGDPGRLWLTAERQTIGRGRGDRGWSSEPGNLYASLLLHLDVPLPTALQLPFVAGVAIHDAIAGAGDGNPDASLALKWPNDLLADGCKVCGILVESRSFAGQHTRSAAIGFGVNVAHHPADTQHPATNLTDRGIRTTPMTLFDRLAGCMAARLATWDNGAGFAAIREEWQARAIDIGSQLAVQDGSDRVCGTYAGLDADGALLLNVGGSVRRFTYGDVMYPARERDRATEQQEE